MIGFMIAGRVHVVEGTASVEARVYGYELTKVPDAAASNEYESHGRQN
jgi:hypothetical protein